MKLITKENQNRDILLVELDVGQVFKYDCDYYVLILKDVNTKLYAECFNLTRNECEEFSYNTEVLPKPNSELHIK